MEDIKCCDAWQMSVKVVLKLFNEKKALIEENTTNYGKACCYLISSLCRDDDDDVVMKPAVDQFYRTAVKMQYGDLFKASPH